ncbi:MAG: peptide deformylase [Nakamurella sp.]
MTVLEADVQRLLDGPRPLPLVLAGDPVLRSPAAPYDFSLPADLWSDLIVAMRETMHDAPGVGLAAPQIGLGIRVAVLEDAASVSAEIAAERQRYPTPPRVLVNPMYDVAEGLRADSAKPAESVDFYEGCLSVPGYQAVVPRSSMLRLRGQDENGTALDEVVHGWAARIVAHETDHLNGILYLDRALTRSLATTASLAGRWSGIAISQVRAELNF